MSFNTPLGTGGRAHVTTVDEDDDGWVASKYDDIDWAALRQSSGWSALQHVVYFNRTIDVITSGVHAIELTGAAEVSLHRIDDPATKRAHLKGDVYATGKGQPHFVNLEVGTYLAEVAAAYDLRASGDPGLRNSPRLKWRLHFERVQRSTHNVLFGSKVAPDLIESYLMGRLANIELENRGLRELRLTLLLEDHLGNTAYVPASITLRRQSLESAAEQGFSSTYEGNSGTVAYATYTPPRQLACSNIALLALHGAGVDPITSPFWTHSIKRRDKQWIVWPLGLTTWGFDWHGPSLIDVKAAVANLETAQKLWAKALTAVNTASACHNPSLISACPSPMQIFVLGHSNGGQGAWYLMSRYPDWVVGGIPASGYVKIQDYVPYHLSVAAHYRDPLLTGILSASLTSLDNDLHASNLQGIPILAIHGSADDNVPVQHSRQMITLVDQWRRRHRSNSSSQYSEILGAGHWFDDVFNSPEASDFIDNVVAGRVKKSVERRFTLTSADPHETGSKQGIRIIELDVPGRIARLEVMIEAETRGFLRVLLMPNNVAALEVDCDIIKQTLGAERVEVKIISVHYLDESRTTFCLRFIAHDAFAINDRVFDSPDEGLIALVEHVFDENSVALVISGNSWHGRELASRLFPLQTGVTIPDWDLTKGGVQSAGFWTNDWTWSAQSSYL
ncbi:hypothetical protein OIO90_002880 [Microbotryomycetes sp. JL221]|nr:hypothetical protein OIO90_002880 [Microbotryomycetes sp. JL221]